MSAPASTSQPAEGEKGKEVAKKVQKLAIAGKDIVDGMAAVTDASINSIISKTVEVAISSISLTIFMIFEYQGFDPDAIIRKLIFLKDHYKMTEEDLKTDIMYMIAANIYMGNMSGKALARRSQQGRDMIDDLTSKYEIKIGTTGTGLSSDVLTFPRVSGSFPVLSAKMASVLPVGEYVGKPFKSSSLPKYMRINAFAALCGSGLAERSRVFLLKAVASFSCDQSIVYEEGRRKKLKLKGNDLNVDPKDIAADQWTYIWASSESKMPAPEVKKKALIDFNVMKEYPKLQPIVENYNKIMDDPTGVPTQSEFESDITNYKT